MKKLLRRLFIGALTLGLIAALAIAVIVKFLLAPAPGEWATRVNAGPFNLSIGVPSTLRLLTAPWFARHLQGRSFQTGYGPIQLRWDDNDRALDLRCAPCRLRVPALGAKPLQLDQLRVRIRRDFEDLNGTIEASTTEGIPARLHGHWNGSLSQRALRLDIDMDEAPIAHWYAIAAPALPELSYAHIGGTLALRMQIEWPSGQMSIQPRIAQFNVEGLGTQALLGANSHCGAPSRLRSDSWLARAVIAAEDQRFFSHPGYDLIELITAFEGNQRHGTVDRGGSTLSQQLAKLVLTGSERSITRKLRELLYAVEMERTLGKARILQLYLDNAPWGPAGLCGTQAAARHYFQRDAQALTPLQAAQLASMLNAPTRAAERWTREGTLDASRVRWVAEGIRGIGVHQRRTLLRELGTCSRSARACADREQVLTPPLAQPAQP